MMVGWQRSIDHGEAVVKEHRHGEAVVIWQGRSSHGQRQWWQTSEVAAAMVRQWWQTSEAVAGEAVVAD